MIGYHNRAGMASHLSPHLSDADSFSWESGSSAKDPSLHPAVTPPLSIPEGAVLVGRSLYTFPDSELARRVIEEDADPELYGGRCVYYGYPIAPRTRWQRLISWLRHQRVRYPFRLVGTLSAVGAVLLGTLRADAAFVLAGLMVALLVGLHLRLTRRRGHVG